MHTSLVRRLSTPLLVAALALPLVACGTTINKIMAEPMRYSHREAKLSGRVIDSVSVLGNGAFQLDDGTGTIWVVSKRGVPRTGARVKVRGRVRDVIDAGHIVKLPPQVGSGLVMIAEDVRAR